MNDLQLASARTYRKALVQRFEQQLAEAKRLAGVPGTDVEEAGRVTAVLASIVFDALMDLHDVTLRQNYRLDFLDKEE